MSISCPSRRTISLRLILGEIMPLDQIADVANIVAAALVIVSLIYVGYQIREAQIAVRAATAQANGLTQNSGPSASLHLQFTGD